MRIELIAVGRARRGPEAELVRRYLDALRWPARVTEIEAKAKSAGPARIAEEGRRLAAALPRADFRLIALDEGGRLLASRDFAKRIETWQDSGTQALAFLIGGADGLDPALAARADLVLSLSKMTLPHLLARAVLAEQIYRAQQILAGHPYHRE